MATAKVKKTSFRFGGQSDHNPLSGNLQEDYRSDKVMQSFLGFMEDSIIWLKNLGKSRTSETYTSTMNSFRRFLRESTSGKGSNDSDVSIVDVDSDMIMAYEAWLRNEGLSHNTSSFYMRNLRAIYNRAVEKGLTLQRCPFRYVYTGVEKTIKRAVSLNVIRQIRKMDLSRNPSQDFAKDMFLFSFYTRGMSFVDMAYLKKTDLSGGILSYIRRKTGQKLFIRWEKCMQEIIDKYDMPESIYLLPIIKVSKNVDERTQYINMSHRVNRGLKNIGKRLELPHPLTMYVARHAWASIARSKNVPLSVISEGMGHNSESTTRIYLASLDRMMIDKANVLILKLLQENDV